MPEDRSAPEEVLELVAAELGAPLTAIQEQYLDYLWAFHSVLYARLNLLRHEGRLVIPKAIGDAIAVELGAMERALASIRVLATSRPPLEADAQHELKSLQLGLLRLKELNDDHCEDPRFGPEVARPELQIAGRLVASLMMPKNPWHAPPQIRERLGLDDSPDAAALRARLDPRMIAPSDYTQATPLSIEDHQAACRIAAACAQDNGFGAEVSALMVQRATAPNRKAFLASVDPLFQAWQLGADPQA